MTVQLLKKFLCFTLAFCVIIAWIFTLPLLYVNAEGRNTSISYYKHTYSTNTTSTYTLSQANTITPSTQTRTSYPDNRYIDTDSSVVQILAGGGQGSGFIIDDHIIATCAHCVYNNSSGSFISSISVKIFSGNNFTTPALTCSPISAHVPVRYHVNSGEFEQSSFDYALLYVEEDLSSYGAFELGVMRDAFLTNAGSVIASGFPGIVHGSENVNNARYYSTGQMGVFDVEDSIEKYPSSCDQRFHATAVISGGDSGGPVYTVTEFNGITYHTVVGIITGGTYTIPSQTGDGTYGVRITFDLLHFYRNNPYVS